MIKDIIWAADAVKVPRALLLAICWGEGAFRSDKELTHMDGGSLSYGTCQIKMSLAKDMVRLYPNSSKKVPLTAENLNNTHTNAYYAALALKFHLQRYDGNWQMAADAYNKYNALGIETEYVKRVNKHLTMVANNITALRD